MFQKMLPLSPTLGKGRPGISAVIPWGEVLLVVNCMGHLGL